jgi:hypothetical protein
VDIFGKEEGGARVDATFRLKPGGRNRKRWRNPLIMLAKLLA